MQEYWSYIMPNINLKKLWRRKSVTISEYDPTYKVTYLGNVLTGWAKGEGCVEKPLATLWRNYCQSNRPDIAMKVTICDAGLKALTKEHGLTEYWAHRVTYCASHPTYPRVFCWVYRHEGRRLKQELRCHAVLCPKGKAEMMAEQLKSRLSAALQEFRREKLIRQNARLSLMHAVYDSASLPLRKVYLITGASNYRPPLERSKSAPKLGAIEEILEEEDEETETEEDHRGRFCEGAEATRSIRCSTAPACSSRSTEEPPSEKVLEGQAASSEISSVDASEVGAFDLHTDEGFNSEAASAIHDHDFLLLEDEDDVRHRLPPRNVERSYSVEINFSSPDLLFYDVAPPSPPHHEEETTARSDGTVTAVSESPTASMQESAEIELLTAFKEKLATRGQGREESLTSDQPESIGSHSCSSSCGGCSDGGADPLPAGDVGSKDVASSGGKALKPLLSLPKGDPEEDCDNISEESGYSEDKECLPLSRVKTAV